MTCSGDSTGGATGPGRLPVSTEYVARYHPPLTFSSLYSRTQKACVAGSTFFDASKPRASAARQPASASASRSFAAFSAEAHQYP